MDERGRVLWPERREVAASAARRFTPAEIRGALIALVFAAGFAALGIVAAIMWPLYIAAALFVIAWLTVLALLILEWRWLRGLSAAWRAIFCIVSTSCAVTMIVGGLSVVSAKRLSMPAVHIADEAVGATPVKSGGKLKHLLIANVTFVNDGDETLEATYRYGFSLVDISTRNQTPLEEYGEDVRQLRAARERAQLLTRIQKSNILHVAPHDREFVTLKFRVLDNAHMDRFFFDHRSRLYVDAIFAFKGKGGTSVIEACFYSDGQRGVAITCPEDVYK